MTISELFEAMKHATEEQNEEALDVLNDIMLTVKRAYPLPYKKYSQKLEKIYDHKEHMTREEALEYVSMFENKDGSKGAHWSMTQIQDYMYSHEEYKDLDPYCFYVAMNMMYSDYYQPERKVDTYAALAKDFLMDVDGGKDKLRKYLEMIHG